MELAADSPGAPLPCIPSILNSRVRAEFAALYVAPTLQNRYLVVMGGVLLAAGCFLALSLVRRQREPVWASVTRLRFLSEELAEAGPASSKGEKSAGAGSNIVGQH
jgi:hypothetical protein